MKNSGNKGKTQKEKQKNVFFAKKIVSNENSYTKKL